MNPFGTPTFLLSSPPSLLAVRCPAVGPTLLAVAPRVPPRPRFLLFLYIYINSFLGSHGRLWGCSFLFQLL